MLIIFQCRSCASRLEIEADTAGATVACPHCQAELVVPRKGLEPGTTVGGFRILRLLGRGGMAEVYLARQVSMDRLVALKILPAAMTLQREAVDRFLHEVKLAARLSHPNLVTAYEAGEDGGVLFFAMAYIEGPSLHTRVKEAGPLPEKEAFAIVRKVATALAYAWNTEKLLHRDLKPSNVLLDGRGEPYLADLGLAKSLKSREAATLSGALVGTPNYMSPEQAEGHGKLDFRTDIYGLGATLYTLLTGRIPYASDNVMETLRRKATEPLPDPRTYNPSISAPALTLLERMLAWNPRHRPASWEALLADVDAVLSGRMPSGRAVSGPPPGDSAEPEPPPAPVLVLVLAGLLAAAALGAGLTWIILQARSSTGKTAAASPPPADTSAPGFSGPGSEAVSTPPPSAVPPAAEPETPPSVPPAAGPRDIAGELFRQARAYFRAHPGDLQGAMERFRKVTDEAPGSPQARRAEDLLRNLETLRARWLAETQDELRREVADLLKDERYDEAMQRLRKQPELVARELAPLRAELIGQVTRARDAARLRARQAAQTAALDDLAGAVLAGRMEEGRSRLSQARQELPEFSESWQSAEADLEAIASGPTLLAAAVGEKIGQTVTLALRDGRMETGRLLAVESGNAVVRVALPAGYAEKRIALAELEPWAKCRWLAAAPAGEAGLARGLWAWEAGDSALARSQFEAAGTPLATALGRQVAAHP